MTSTHQSNFEKLLAARKNIKILRANQKRLDGIKTIEKRMQLKPFPPGSFENFKSQHVWEDVLKYTKPLDISSLGATCSTFQSLMEGKEVLLMTEALKVMKNKGYLEAEEMSPREQLDFLQHQLSQRFPGWREGLPLELGRGNPPPADAEALPLEQIFQPLFQDVFAQLHEFVQNLNPELLQRLQQFVHNHGNLEIGPVPILNEAEQQQELVIPFDLLPYLQQGLGFMREMFREINEARRAQPEVNLQRTPQESEDHPPPHLPFERNIKRIELHLQRRRFFQEREIHHGGMVRRREFRPRIMYKFTFLQLRLLSKAWKQATDDAFIHEFRKDWYLEISPLLAFSNPSFSKIIVVDHVDLEYANLILESTTSAPPMMQILEIYEFTDDNVDNFTPQLMEFLEKYGTCVRAVIINWCGITHCSPNTKYDRLLSLVTRMPNLKALIMRGDSDGFPNARPSTENERSRRRPPFPSLQHLELLSLQEGYTEDNVILREIFTKCTNLKSILMPSLISDDYTGAVMEAMKHLRMISFQQNDWLFPEGLLANVTWPLKKFAARNCSLSGSDCAVLNQFHGSLEILELGTLTLENDKVILKLEKLKEFYLGGIVNEHFTGLDFLIPLEALEMLEFTCPQSFLRRSPGSRVYLIDIYEHVGGMETSNIWRCFPFLEKLHISGGVGPFSRSGEGDFVEYVKEDGVVFKK